MATPRPASLARRVLPAVAIAGLSGGILVKLDHPAPASASGGLEATATTRAGRTTTAVDRADDAVETPSTTRPRTTTTIARTPRTTVAAGRTTPTIPATRPAASTATPSTAVPATDAPAQAVEAAGTCDTEPVAGPTVSTRWGPVQVAAVFDADGALCDVEVLQYPADHRKSVSINQRALPVLTREALAAASADIDIVTGATITSDAYATSLQAILDGRA